MARKKRVLCNTAETNLGVTYQMGYPVDDNENTTGKVAWGKLIGLNGAGTSVKQYGAGTGSTIIEADASTNTPALGVMTSTTTRDQYAGLSFDEELFFYKLGERENRLFNLVKKVTLADFNDANKDAQYYATAKTQKTGTVTVTIGTSTTAIVGVGTAFTTEFVVGDYIAIENEVRQIASITDATHMAVSEGFVSNHSAKPIFRDIDVGKPIWLTTNGDFTIIKPVTAGTFRQQVGYVESAHTVVIDLNKDPFGEIVA